MEQNDLRETKNVHERLAGETQSRWPQRATAKGRQVKFSYTILFVADTQRSSRFVVRSA